MASIDDDKHNSGNASSDKEKTLTGNDLRRIWDRDEYSAKAESRLTREEEEEKAKNDKNKIPVKRALLKHRDYKVDLESKLGKTTIITKSTPQSQMGGYYCDVCDCVVKDSINYLDHINGKKHQRNMGMSMKVARSTVEQVKKRFDTNKRKLEEKAQEEKYNLNSRLSELKEEEDKERQTRKSRERENKRRKRDEEEELHASNYDEDVASIMGFGGFGAGKRN